MNLAIITGTSKGLGEELANQLLDKGYHVLGIARSSSESLAGNDAYTHLSCDIGNLEALEQTIEQVKQSIEEKQLNSVLLINNAGIVNPINQASEVESDALVKNVQVNTIAPMVTTNKLLNYCSKNDIKLVCGTVTSGAAERPFFGWSVYCSAKASVNMYTETVALEQEELGKPHKFIAFSPGVMDTNMQEVIRSSSESEFKDIADFKALKSENRLAQASDVATQLLNILLDDESIKNGTVYYAK
ncbi:MAG TPA: (S)-benzoin forming benzil reductase [Bacillota bacterium]|nr:(S)-benzoin forming benzil reductase [Bacillota bacterium]